MKPFTIASMGVAIAALAAGAAFAQVQYPPSSNDGYQNYQSYQTPDYPPSGYGAYGPRYTGEGYSGQPAYNRYDQNQPAYNGYSRRAPAYNAQSYQDYQNAMSAYDAARDTAARQGSDYDQNSADYMANQKAYRRQLREYNHARAAYDDEYGPGAYEEYYSPPMPPPY